MSIETHAYLSETGTVTTLEATPGVGYLLAECVLGEERQLKGFYYSSDQAAQEFFRLTGVELAVEEVAT